MVFYTASMDLAPVAAEYIKTHRADCTDAEIRKALKDQGFSEEVLDDAFHAAGVRPAGSAPKNAPFLRGMVWLLSVVSLLLFIGAALLLVRNLKQAP